MCSVNPLSLHNQVGKKFNAKWRPYELCWHVHQPFGTFQLDQSVVGTNELGKNGSEMERCHIHRVRKWVHGRNIEEELNASIFEVFVQDSLAFSPVLPWEVGALGKNKRNETEKTKNAQLPRNLNKLNANFTQVRDRCPKHLTRTTVAWRYNFHYAHFINSCQCSPASNTPFIPARIVCLVHARAHQNLFPRIHSTGHAQRHHSFENELYI